MEEEGTQLTLKEARELSGYSKETVSKYCDISELDLEKMERYSKDIKSSILIKLRSLYGIPLDLIKLA